MILIVMRHGQSEADLLNVFEGRADFDLTELGITQVESSVQTIVSKYQITKIFSSPLIRAKHTAEILNKYVNKHIVYLDDLQEFNNGLLAGMKREEANKKYPKDDNLPFDRSMYGMESLLDFRLRAQNALNFIIENANNDDIIAVVCHGGIINRLYQSFLQMPLQTETRYLTKDAGYHIWKIENNIRSIISSNN